MLRFVGITGSGATSDIALDALGVGFGVPVLGLEHLACDFAWDTCGWLNTGNASWQRASGQATGGWLEAEGNASDGQLFIFESPLLTPTTAEKGLAFSYMMAGSSSVSLEVEHKTEFGGWSTLFAESGDTGAEWKGAPVRVPEGTVGVRLLAGAGVGAVVKVDWILAVETANWANIGCTFEVDFCGWSSVFDPTWVFKQGRTGTTKTGPTEALEGDWYIYTEASETFNKAGRCRELFALTMRAHTSNPHMCFSPRTAACKVLIGWFVRRRRTSFRRGISDLRRMQQRRPVFLDDTVGEGKRRGTGRGCERYEEGVRHFVLETRIGMTNGTAYDSN